MLKGYWSGVLTGVLLGVGAAVLLRDSKIESAPITRQVKAQSKRALNYFNNLGD